MCVCACEGKVAACSHIFCYKHLTQFLSHFWSSGSLTSLVLCFSDSDWCRDVKTINVNEQMTLNDVLNNCSLYEHPGFVTSIKYSFKYVLFTDYPDNYLDRVKNIHSLSTGERLITDLFPVVLL